MDFMDLGARQETLNIRGEPILLQLCVVPAYALTVHKTQTLSIKHLVLGCLEGVFALGQVYVLMSRVALSCKVKQFVWGSMFLFYICSMDFVRHKETIRGWLLCFGAPLLNETVFYFWSVQKIRSSPDGSGKENQPNIIERETNGGNKSNGFSLQLRCYRPTESMPQWCHAS